ncbi:DUF4307 domain-containing protein [Microbacterium sp. SYP-A9085]|uniref:DUF4307 domain-containing protein n=1 Tax=Microbacterium sp. SYP-A9085 TaxID=2664454 RepID=UPI00129AD124|nr:DUF4307 domain-containing protein [Microbacterium sp. SYP-A9085]MRH28661.1 DUF4307 domain-containing protein [Microbacterium sp. SYP-A9085]
MTTQQMLDERYGRTRSLRSRVTAGVAIGAVAAGAVGFMVWSSFASSADAVDAVATGYQVVDARTVRLDFQLTAPVGSAIVCVLEADDTDHGVVGWKVVSLPASTSHTHAYAETIPTVGEATTGLVNTCWVS